MTDNWTIEDYDVFTHNLQSTQYYFYNDNNWYNGVIDYILSILAAKDYRSINQTRFLMVQ